MPVRINEALPAYRLLTQENIFVMSESRARMQDIRPLEIAILNIMPTKVVTETQLLRLLGNTPLQINITLLNTESYASRNISPEHLESFYTTFTGIKAKRFDGLIVTGAPVEQLPFTEVAYWSELAGLLDWAKTHVFSTLFICWGAQAGLYHYYGIQKRELPEKCSGVFCHWVLEERVKLLRGFDQRFYAPHSRYTAVAREDILAHPELTLLAEAEEAGVYLVTAREGREVYVTGHPEYDPDTLALEYLRDINKGLQVKIPAHYFPEDDPSKPPMVRWRSHANLLFLNWLNYCVYQETPYKLKDIK